MATARKKLIALPINFRVPENFINEPLFRFLKNIRLWSFQLAEHQWAVFVIFCLIGILDDLIVGALTHNWESSPGVVGVSDVNNIPPLIMSLIVEPGMWTFFVAFPSAVFNIFKTINEKMVLLSEEQFVQQQVDRLQKVYDSWWFWLTVLPLTFLITYYAQLIIGEYHPVPWFYRGWHYGVLLVRIFGAVYVTVYSVSWSLLALYTLHRVLSRARIKVNAYDGDNAGGLRFIGTFILSVSRLVLIVVPFLVAETLFAIRLGRGIIGQFNLWMEIIILPLLLTLMVFLPLTACRRAMFAAKDEFLNPLRDKILTHVALTYPPSTISKVQLAEITALIDFQTKLRRDYPTWPFDVTMTQQIGVSFALTLLPILFNIILQVAR